MWIKGEYHANFNTAQEVARGDLDASNVPGAGQSDLFDTLAWFEMLHRYCAPRSSPAIIRARAEHTDMWLFLVHQSRTQLQSLTNAYSFHFRPVFSGDLSPDTRIALVKGSAKRLKRKYSHILLNAVPETDGTLDLLRSGFGRAGWLVIPNPAETNLYLDVGGRDFASYWASRPAPLREMAERKARKGLLDISVHHRFDNVAWTEYEAVAAHSGTIHEDTADFFRALAQEAGKTGRLRLGIAREGGHAVAAQFWTVDGRTANIHRMADIADADGLSPGTLLSQAMFRDVIDVDKVERIDFGAGDQAYKRDWADSAAPLYRIDLLNLKKPQAWLPAIRESLSHLRRSRTT